MIVVCQHPRNGGGIRRGDNEYIRKRSNAEKQAEMRRWIEMFIKGKRRK